MQRRFAGLVCGIDERSHDMIVCVSGAAARKSSALRLSCIRQNACIATHVVVSFRLDD